MDKIITIKRHDAERLGLTFSPDDVNINKAKKRFKNLKKALVAAGGSLTVETVFPLHTSEIDIPDMIPVFICKTTFKLTKKGNVKMSANVKEKLIGMKDKISHAVYAHIMKWTEYFRTTEFKDDFKLLVLDNPEDFWENFPKDPTDLPKELVEVTKELTSSQVKVGDSLKLAVEIKNDQVAVSTMIIVDYSVDENRVEIFCPTEGRIIVMTNDEFMHAKALKIHCVVKNIIEPDNNHEQMIKTISDKLIPNLKKDLGKMPEPDTIKDDMAVSVFVKEVMSEIVPEIKKMVDNKKGTFKISKKGKIKDTGIEFDQTLFAKICSAIHTSYKHSNNFVGLIAKKHKTDEGVEVFLRAKIIDVDLDQSTGTMVGSIETSKRGVEKFRLTPKEFALDVIRFVEMELITGESDNPMFIVKKKETEDVLTEVVNDIMDGLKNIIK